MNKKLYGYAGLFAACSILAVYGQGSVLVQENFEQKDALHEREKSGESQYDEKFVKLIELLCGEGLMSFGGTVSLDAMFEGIDLLDKTIIDFGCGGGGHDTYLAEKYPSAQITAVDVDTMILAQAKQRAGERGLGKNLCFSLIEKNTTLPFADNTFDIVFAKESFLHVKEKAFLFKEFFRVLKPGSVLVIDDWFYTQPEFDEDMKAMVEIDKLEYNLIQPEVYCSLVQDAGFTDVTYKDTTDFTLAEFRKHIQNLEGTYNQKIKDEFGEQYLAYALDGWKLNEKIFVGGKLRTARVKAYKK